MSMIESGLYSWALANPAITPFLGQTPQDAAKKIYSAFFFSFLPKEPRGVMPGIILDRLKSPDEIDTIDARSPAPGNPIEGRFQFGSVAQDSAQNPKNPDGYLSACFLSQALRRQLTGLASGQPVPLGNGTVIQNVYGWDEWDSHYEVGGYGYILRRILQCTIVFYETT
jgi:hypothetical protein